MGFSKTFLIFTFVAVLVFALFPQLDLDTSSLFYHKGEGFYLSDFWIFHFLYKRVGWILGVTVLALLLYLFYQIKTGKQAHYLNKKGITFLLLFLLLGPGLITNVLIKEHSGRVRPVQIEQFGGQKAFTPYYRMDGACEHNCSFISGHAAAGFFFLAFGYLLHSRMIFLLALGFGVLMALTRVAQGGHFLSDVVFTLIINLIVLKILYYLFFKKEATLEK